VRDDRVVIDLVTRASHGDERAWGALVERYSSLIWSICRRYRLGDADAEDAVQSVWLRAAGQLGAIRDPAALPGWLATVTRRECLRVLRAVPGPLTARNGPDAETIPDEQAWTAEQELLAAERHTALRAAFSELPPSDRRLIRLLIQDPPVSYTQISAQLGIPIGSIGPTRRRCLDKLRRHPAIAALISTDTSGPADRGTAAAIDRSQPERSAPPIWRLAALPVSRSSGASSATDLAERAACLLISAQRPDPHPGVSPCQRENPEPKEWAGHGTGPAMTAISAACAAIARPYAPRIPGQDRHDARLSGTADLQSRTNAVMPGPARHDGKDTANAVGW
jgi:RNA polymerase sigma factor (sigma-70 family)